MRAKLILWFTTAESRVNIWIVKLIYSPPPSPEASTVVPSKAVILLLFIYCLLLLPLFVGL